ncbi:MAG: hypothetical protein KDJ31_14945 [Candidatus Competibacteraceae bacterium]|nr:hypothetical protein [Candidatus Competibacteraceae bacterium]
MEANRITDFTHWNLRDNFNDYESAYLWLGLEPNYNNDHPSAVTGMRLTLAEAQRRGELTNQSRIPLTSYSRQDLKQYAERHNQRPLFLFLDDQHSSASDSVNIVSCGNEDTPPRAKSTLLKMLDAALSQQYGQDWLDGDVETLAYKWMKDLELEGIPIPAEKRAMNKWLAEIKARRK